ncbi:hypothetical protein VN97_g11508 [Penicillium thymicola]|uniref:Uncharacterized protein n=1 Tax=Penicillium thymicola TaxID=293382 RepID=A0AAI9T7Y0_PENTH|nr:hypothetical protein VN97_g11508 [Penicillium thymicola]
MGPAIDPLLVDDHPWWLEKAYEIFQEMVVAGNQVARFRWSELQQLEKTLHEITHTQSASSTSDAVSQDPGAIPQLLSPATSCIPSVNRGFCNDPSLTADTTLDAEYGFGPILTSAEMTAMADSIEMYDAEWISNAMMIHDIW